jgi:N-acetylmuramoyl-L-alanine amidase
LNKQIRPYRVVEDTKVRAGPGAQFRAVGEVKQDSRVQVLGRDGEWLLIISRKGNAPGYIAIASAKPARDEPAQAGSGARPVGALYEAVANTRVRSGPGFDHSAVAEIKKGTKMYVVSEENGWLRVESKRGNPPGYVEAALARPLPGSAQANPN